MEVCQLCAPGAAVAAVLGVVVGRLPLDQSSHVLWSLDCHVSGVGLGVLCGTGVGVFVGSACTVPNGTVPSLICSGSSVGSG